MVQRRDPMSILLELTRQLASTSELDPCMQAVTDAAMALMTCDHCSIRIFDDNAEQLLAAARSGSGTTFKAVNFRVGEGVVGWVAAENRAVRIDDTLQDERFKNVGNQGFRIRSLLAAPLSTGARVIGVLSATSPTPGAFSEVDELYAQMLANIAVPVIERFRLELLALTDPVTLALNHRALAIRLEEELERAKRYGVALSIMGLELFGLEQLCSAQGQEACDETLRSIAKRLQQSIRRADVLLRRSSAEFLVLMPHTHRGQAQIAAERLAQELRELLAAAEQAAPLELCLCTLLATAEDTPATLEARCVALMSAAREAGRRGILCEPEG
ncbi:MAG: diguanylate cyclase [Myxococcota bacterium]|jgi:diguanylate cyclase (GGDEF)-like protein|nr:diguanylate cyclase [Myxococcota bacterium]